MYQYCRYLFILFALIISGCARAGIDSSRGSQEAREPALARQAGEETRPRPIEAEILDEPTGVVTLNEAVGFALVNSPQLRAFSRALRAAEARELQAGLRPNPEVELEIEEFGGSGPLSGLGAAETSIRLGQLIELGDKRAKRARLAGIETDLERWEYEAQKLDVMQRVASAFVDVLAAQEQVALVDELVELSEKSYGAVEQRVAAGKDSPVELTKARVAVSTAKLSHARAGQALASARMQLALAWGSEAPAYEKVSGAFYVVSRVPSFDALARLLETTPDLERWSSETRRRQAALELERARAVPGVNITGGVAHFREIDDTAFIVGLAVPLQMFDRNQGEIEAATQMLAKSRDDSKAAQMSVRTALAKAVQGLSTAFTESSLLRDEVLPAAQSAYEAADEGYRQGKFDYLDVLDAQRTLFEARVQYVASLTTYHKTRAAIERLIGQALPERADLSTVTPKPKPLSEDSSDEK